MRSIVLVLTLMAGPALAQTPEVPPPEAPRPEASPGDPVAGEAAFKRCTACHSIGEGAGNRMGPYLTGVVGRPAATAERFGYSTGMKTARDAGLVWTPEALQAFLSGPHDYVPGTKMPNVMVRDATDRANIVAYLRTFSPDFDPEAQVSTYAPPG